MATPSPRRCGTPSTTRASPTPCRHHTDTFALFYNIEALESLGIAVPTKLSDAWTWARFIEVAKAVKAKGIGNYPFAMSWQNSSTHRWLIYLYQHGGRILGDKFDTVEIDNAAGIETVAWTQSWFKEGLVPPRPRSSPPKPCRTCSPTAPSR